MLRSFCTLLLISPLCLPAQSQEVDATAGLFDVDWQKRNRCAEALFAASAPPIAQLIEIASGDATAEYRGRGVNDWDFPRSVDWRVDLEGETYGRLSSMALGRRGLPVSLIVKAGVRSFLPTVPWSSRQLAIWLVGAKGDDGQVKELMRRVIASRPWNLEAVEVLACVWFERLPDQVESLLPFLLLPRTQRILAQEISRRADADKTWLCALVDDQPRAVGALLLMDPAFLARSAGARETIAKFYLSTKTQDRQAGSMSVPLRSGSAGVPLAIMTALGSRDVKVLSRALSVFDRWKVIPESAYVGLVALLNRENTYVSTLALRNLAKAATTSKQQKEAQSLALEAFKTTTDSIKRVQALISLRACQLADSAELLAAMRPLLDDRQFAGEAFTVLKERGLLSVLSFGEVLAFVNQHYGLIDKPFYMREGKRADRYLFVTGYSQSDALSELASRGDSGISQLVGALSAEEVQEAFAHIDSDELARVRSWLDSPAWERQCAALHAMLMRDNMSRQDFDAEYAIIETKKRLSPKARLLLAKLLVQRWPDSSSTLDVLRALLNDSDKAIQSAAMSLMISHELAVVKFQDRVKGATRKVYWGRYSKKRFGELMDKGLINRGDFLMLLGDMNHPAHRFAVGRLIAESPWPEGLRPAIKRLQLSVDRLASFVRPTASDIDCVWLASVLKNAAPDAKGVDDILRDLMRGGYSQSEAWRSLAYRSQVARGR